MSSHLWLAMKFLWLVVAVFFLFFLFFLFFILFIYFFFVSVGGGWGPCFCYVYFHTLNNLSVYVLPEVALTSSVINKKAIQKAMIL